MATKTAKTRNPDRRGSGKAWSKNHDAPAKVLTEEQKERKAKKIAERETKHPLRLERGSSLTMPTLSWEWCTSALAGRMTNTRRYRISEAVLNQERRGRTYDVPTAIEPNPEAKPLQKKR